MVQRDVHIEDPWVYGGDAPKTSAQSFFESYAMGVDARMFASTITQYYGDLTVYRSETGKVFHGAEEMKQWMNTLFFSFERVQHLPEKYLEIANPDGTVKVHLSVRRRLWLKGNISNEPDTEYSDGLDVYYWASGRDRGIPWVTLPGCELVLGQDLDRAIARTKTAL